MKYSEIWESEILEVKSKKFSDLPNYENIITRYDIKVDDRGLTSLNGSPDIVEGRFDCSENQLETLFGGPKSTGGYFNCMNNPLDNLVGSPITVGAEFYCGQSNYSTTLVGITTKQINGTFFCFGNITGLMSLFKVKGIKQVNLVNMAADVTRLSNKYISNPRGALAFQAEMIASGYKEYL